MLLFWDKSNVVLRFSNPIKYTEYVKKYAEENRLDPHLVLAIIRTESNFNEEAVSSKSAKGLMQITKNTGLWGASVLNINDYSEKKLFDPETNIKIGCWYFSNLKNQFKSTDLAIVAYNGGSGNLERWLKKNKIDIKHKNWVSNIPYKETREYIKKVKKMYSLYLRLYENYNW